MASPKHTLTLKYQDGTDEVFECVGYFFESGHMFIAYDSLTIKVRELKGICEMTLKPNPNVHSDLKEQLNELAEEAERMFNLDGDTNSDPGTKH